MSEQLNMQCQLLLDPTKLRPAVILHKNIITNEANLFHCTVRSLIALYPWITSVPVDVICRSASPSPAPPEDRAPVWWHLLHRGVIWMSFRPHRGAGRAVQLLATHQSLLWLGQSWTCPLHWTLPVDPLLQWWRAGGDWLPGPVQLYCRWLKHSGMVHRSLYGNVHTAPSYYSLRSNASDSVIFDCLYNFPYEDPEFHLHVGGLLNPIPGSVTTQLSHLK